LRKADFAPEAVLPEPLADDEREDLMDLDPIGTA
jgi:hypothetical protein